MSITHQRIIPTEERQEARHGSVTRNAARDEAGLSNCGANGRAFQEQRKEGRQEVRGEEGETKEVTLATAFSEK